MSLDQIHSLDESDILLWDDPQHLAGLPPLLARDNHHAVVLANVHPKALSLQLSAISFFQVLLIAEG